jgi:hypothetical protein
MTEDERMAFWGDLVDPITALLGGLVVRGEFKLVKVVQAMLDKAENAAAAEREECIQIAHDTYEGFGASAQGVNFVKQRIMEEIRARGKND